MQDREGQNRARRRVSVGGDVVGGGAPGVPGSAAAGRAPARDAAPNSRRRPRERIPPHRHSQRRSLSAHAARSDRVSAVIRRGNEMAARHVPADAEEGLGRRGGQRRIDCEETAAASGRLHAD